MDRKKLIGLFLLGVLMISRYGLCGDNVNITIKATINENWTQFNLTSGDAMTIRILNISTANVTFIRGPGILVSPIGGKYPSLAPIVTLYFDLNGSVYAFFPSKTLSLGEWKKGGNVTLFLTDRKITLKNGNIIKSFEAPTEIEPVHYLTGRTTSRMMNATLQIEKFSLFNKKPQKTGNTIPSMSFVYFLVVLGVGVLALILYRKR
ncbi:hypothetical protein [Thermococcus sp.]|uniref:hypothetical protein n=1 Tax=Thermococcus sp. TaxID=35749 RepID=UPI002608E46B|nr:hypothetical protein [Thermococcus sp.]